MNRLISLSIFAVALVFSTVAFAQDSAQTPADTTQDTVDVQHVMDAYHEAVVTHDGSRLDALFIPEGSTWLNVLSDDAYARAKAKSPDAVKVRVGSYKDFSKLVSTSKANFNPTHTNIRIQSNGTIASVYFDFVFLIDGKGAESWQRKPGNWSKVATAGGLPQ